MCSKASISIVQSGHMQDRWVSLIVTWLAEIRCVVTIMLPVTLCIRKLFNTASMLWVLFVVFPMLFQFIMSPRLIVLVCKLKLMSRNACSSVLFIRNPSRLFALSSLYIL